MLVEIKRLKINPYHSKIYPKNDIITMVESIDEYGLLQKIVVNEQLIIISGVRRFLAIQELKWKTVDVEIKDVDEEVEISTLIAFNEQREKTCREKLNEAEYLKIKWGQKRGRKSVDVEDFFEIESNTKQVDTRKRISEKLGISAGNISKLEYINKQKPELIEAIDNGKLTINQAHYALKKVEYEQEAIQQSTTLATTISSDYFTIYNKTSDNLSDLEDESIQTIFTSPPYWKKRTYSNLRDELGAEENRKDYVKRMANHLHQCHRVLKKTGSFFLNLGDTYENKNLQIIPHRIIIKLQKKGWILRNTIIWEKKNHKPSSCKDNLTPSYEYIFHLVKSDLYDYNQIRIPTIYKTSQVVYSISNKCKNGIISDYYSASISGLKSGKNIDDFWKYDIVSAATANQAIVKKYGGTEHPAPFPPEIVALPILQTSQPGDVVMDVFSGTATVGEVAILLGRKYVGYELNPNHNDVQERRLNDAVDIYNKELLSKQAA